MSLVEEMADYARDLELRLSSDYAKTGVQRWFRALSEDETQTLARRIRDWVEVLREKENAL